MNTKTGYDQTTTTKPDATTTNSADEAAIRSLYRQMMEGWNKGSSQAFAAPFTEDADFIAFDGTRFKGRQEIALAHQPLFDKWLKGTRLVEYSTQVRVLRPDIALMQVIGGTVMRGQTEPAPERVSIQTLVAVKRDSHWWLASFQNTRIRPMGRNAVSALLWMFFDWLWKVFRLNKEPYR
jgi:uncharacterized protein (TIGR02246 family)